MAADRWPPSLLGHYVLKPPEKNSVWGRCWGARALNQYLKLGGHEVGRLQERVGSGERSRGPKCRAEELALGKVVRKGTGER